MTDRLILGDNLTELKKLADATIDLIYIDPPFNIGKRFLSKTGSGYDDKFKSRDDYLDFIGARLVECKRVLKTTGSIYLHCQPSISHYLKMLMDSIFGESNFKNEIIWESNWGQTQTTNHEPRKYGNTHATILFYGVGSNTYFNGWVDLKPLSAKVMKDFNREDDKGIYRKATLILTLYRLGTSKGLFFKYKGITPPKNSGGWCGRKEFLDKLDKQGDIFMEDGMVWRKYRPGRGCRLGTIWTDIKPVNWQVPEWQHYPTQKPLALLERIIKASSNEGDVVLDAFCGSGTTCVAAKNLGRHYIGIDANPDAIKIATERLQEGGLL